MNENVELIKKRKAEEEKSESALFKKPKLNFNQPLNNSNSQTQESVKAKTTIFALQESIYPSNQIMHDFSAYGGVEIEQSIISNQMPINPQSLQQNNNRLNDQSINNINVNNGDLRINQITENYNLPENFTAEQLQQLLASRHRLNDEQDIYELPALSNFFLPNSRQEKIKELTLKFADDEELNAKIVVIAGMRGVGKSQLAIKYIQIYKKNYKDRCRWIDVEQIESSFDELAEILNVNEENHKRKIRLIYKKLEQTGKVLFIFDNAKKLSDIKEYLPTDNVNKSKFHILITSDNLNAWSGYSVIEMNPESPDMQEDARNYIKSFIEVTGLPPVKNTEVELLAKELGYLILAVAQAVNYINQKKASDPIADYIDNYKKMKEVFLKHKVPKSDQYNLTVLLAFSMTFKQIKQDEDAGEVAISILYICSYLFPKNISKILLCSHICQYNNAIDPYTYDLAISLLTSYMLISLNENRKYFSIHSLVQDVIQIELENNHVKAAISELNDSYISSNRKPIKLIDAISFATSNFTYPSNEQTAEKLTEYKHMLPHARTTLSHAIRLKYESSQIGDLNYKIGSYYVNQLYDYVEAKKYFLEADRYNTEENDISKSQINRYLFKIHLDVADKASKGIFKRYLKTKEEQDKQKKKINEVQANLKEAKKYLKKYTSNSKNVSDTYCNWANFYLKKVKFIKNNNLKIEDEEVKNSGTIEPIPAIHETKNSKLNKAFAQLEKARLLLNLSDKDSALIKHYYGIYYQNNGMPIDAINAYKESLKLKLKIPDLREAARTCKSIANTYQALYNQKKDEIYLKNALKYYEACIFFNEKLYPDYLSIDIITALIKISDIHSRNNQIQIAISIKLFITYASNEMGVSNIENHRKIISLYQTLNLPIKAKNYILAFENQETRQTLINENERLFNKSEGDTQYTQTNEFFISKDKIKEYITVDGQEVIKLFDNNISPQEISYYYKPVKK